MRPQRRRPRPTPISWSRSSAHLFSQSYTSEMPRHYRVTYVSSIADEQDVRATVTRNVVAIVDDEGSHWSLSIQRRSGINAHDDYLIEINARRIRRRPTRVQVLLSVQFRTLSRAFGESAIWAPYRCGDLLLRRSREAPTECHRRNATRFAAPAARAQGIRSRKSRVHDEAGAATKTKHRPERSKQ